MSRNGTDHETFWAAYRNDRDCAQCGNSRVQYRAKMVQYRGDDYLKPITNRLFCCGCETHIGYTR